MERMGDFESERPSRESDYYWNNTDFSRRLRFSRAMVGTDKGVFTARIDTKNPKTKDGKNTVIFRRSPAETVLEVQGAPVLKAAEKALPEGIKVGDKSIRYTPEERRQIRRFVKTAAKSQSGRVENPDFGTITIGHDFVNEVLTHSISTAREIASVSSAREIAATMKHFAAAPNEEVKAGRNNYIEYGLAKFEFEGSTYLVMGEVGVRKDFTPYYDQRVVAKLKADRSPSILHDVEGTKSALDEIYDNRFRILLQGVNEFNKTGVSAQGENLRMSRSGIFTGTAADYANRSRQGGVDDGPSVKKIGTGEGTQVYGWGLYGSTEHGVAENYAKKGWFNWNVNREVTRNGRQIDADLTEKAEREKNDVFIDYQADDIAWRALYNARGDIAKAAKWVDYIVYDNRPDIRAERADELHRKIFDRAIDRVKNHAEEFNWKEFLAHKYLYEQTFFTNRAPGDESHLLKWYEPVSEEQRKWILHQLEQENLAGETNLKRIRSEKMTGRQMYELLSGMINIGSEKAASEFLYRAGIDGVKYPVDSYGKTVKDGDKAGWNYVAFSDEHIRVDHKWTDGQQRYSRRLTGFDGPSGGMAPATAAQLSKSASPTRR